MWIHRTSFNKSWLPAPCAIAVIVLIVSCPGPGVRRSRCFASYFQRNETLAVSRPTCCFLQHINIVNWNSSDIQISNNTLSVSWNLHKVRSSAFSSSICSDMSSNRWAHLQKSQKNVSGASSNPTKPWKKTLTIARKGPQPWGHPPMTVSSHLSLSSNSWSSSSDAFFCSSMLGVASWQGAWWVFTIYMTYVEHVSIISYIYIYIHHTVETYTTSVILMLVLRTSTVPVSSYVYNVNKRGWPHWLSTDLRIRATEGK